MTEGIGEDGGKRRGDEKLDSVDVFSNSLCMHCGDGNLAKNERVNKRD